MEPFSRVSAIFPYVSSVESSPRHLVHWFPPVYAQVFQVTSLLSGIPTEPVLAFLFPPMCATRPTHPIRLYIITLTFGVI